MEKLILQNFRAPSLGKTLRPHRLIKGFIPFWIDLVSESNDSDYREKVNPPYPLVLGPTRTSIRTKSSKAIVAMTEQYGALASDSKIIYSLNDWNLFADDATQIDLGVPTTVANNEKIDLIITKIGASSQRVITTNADLGTGVLYYKAVNDTGAYSNSTGAPTDTFLLEVFEDRVAAIGKTDITMFDSSLAAETGNWSRGGDIGRILDCRNYQDKYLLIFGGKGGNTPGPAQKDTPVLAWIPITGSNTSNYEFRIFIEGRYKACVKKDNTLYVFTQIGSTVVCWKYIGAAFEEVGRIKNVIISETLDNPKTRASFEDKFFILMATSPGNVTTVSPFYWNPITGENFFLHDDATYDYTCVMTTQDSNGDYVRYFAFNDNGTATLSKFTLTNSSKSARGAYKSGIIQIPRYSKEDVMGRGLIKSIEIEWNELPTDVNGAEKLDVTFRTKDGYVTETVSSQTASCQATNALSTNARVSAKRAILSLGAMCTEFEIDLTLTNTTNAWDLIIRRIIINYEPSRLQQ